MWNPPIGWAAADAYRAQILHYFMRRPRASVHTDVSMASPPPQQQQSQHVQTDRNRISALTLLFTNTSRLKHNFLQFDLDIPPRRHKLTLFGLAKSDIFSVCQFVMVFSIDASHILIWKLIGHGLEVIRHVYIVRFRWPRYRFEFADFLEFARKSYEFMKSTHRTKRELK